MSENEFKIISQTVVVCFPHEPQWFGELWQTVVDRTPQELNHCIVVLFMGQTELWGLCTVHGSNCGQY